MTITYEDASKRRIPSNFIGVWVNGNPAGRIRPHEGQFRAFTNKREPGKAFLGTFPTQEQAGERVAQEHLA